MLQAIHDKSKGILGIVIVILIGATFALWGIGDYLSGASQKPAAIVDGEEISQAEFDQGMARQRQRLEQMFQGQIPDSPLFEQQMKQQVLDQLITQRLLTKLAQDQGYRVADQVLAARIRQMEAFQQEGAFAKDYYQSIVESQGMTVKEFENLYRQDLAIQQIQDAVMGSAFISDLELNLINQIQKQRRDIRYLEFTSQSYISDINVSEDEINAYYEQNKSRYMHPETVTVDYVELKGSKLAADIPVDDEAVRRLYDDYVSSLAGKEQRKASHILISSATDDQAKEAEAAELLARIKSGESFAELAKQSSEDPGSASKGGDLGWVSKGMMVAPFETALFKLEKGAVSDVVKSQFGYHIIKLADIKSEQPASFESKQAELTQQFKEQLIEDRFYEQSELMATTAYENDQSLQEVADVLDLPIKTTAAFSRAIGTGIAENEKVRQAAFDQAVKSEGRNSDIIELEKNHAVVIRINTLTAARQKTLEEVRAQLVSTLKAEKASELVQQAAEDVLQKVNAGESLDSFASMEHAKLVKPGKVTRDSQDVNRQLITAVFGMPKPANKPVYQVVQLISGAAVVELNAVESPEQASKEELAMIARQLGNSQGNREMAALIDYLKSQADITRLADKAEQ